MDTSLTPRPTLPTKKGMNLKKQLALLLELRSMSAAELSRRSGVPKQSISGWLAGSNPRDIRQLKKVAEVLKVSVDELVFGEGTNTQKEFKQGAIDHLIGDEWLTGLFEVKLRRIKR